MMDSILISVKKMLGADKNYNVFDPDIIIHINSVFATLYQMGVVSNEGKPFSIINENSKWTDFNIRADTDLAEIKTYMYLKVRTLFDPPTNSSLYSAMKEQINEFEWRLYIETDTYPKEEDSYDKV